MGDKPDELWDTKPVASPGADGVVIPLPPGMDVVEIYALLQKACRLLENAEEHSIAAYVGHSMAMIQARFGVGRDHLDDSGT